MNWAMRGPVLVIFDLPHVIVSHNAFASIIAFFLVVAVRGVCMSASSGISAFGLD
jgi:hypothetical protein